MCPIINTNIGIIFCAFKVDYTKNLIEDAQKGDEWNKGGVGKENGHDGEIPRWHNKA